MEENIKLNREVFNRGNFDKLLASDEPTDSWRNAIYYFLQNWFDDSDFIISHTSGSTGAPKEIRLLKTAMRNSARMTNTFFGLDETKTALLCLPASYIAGKMMLVRAIVGGFNLIAVKPKANPFKTLDFPIYFTAITPYQLSYSAETLKTKPVQNIIVGGGHVNSKMEEVAAEIPASMYETYGMTETCSHIALRCLNGAKRSDYFTSLEGVTIDLDERGCLVISAPHLLTNEIVTNDIVELHGTHNFRWLGRADSVINSGGVKIFPEQVEKKLGKIISSNFFIASLPDVKLGSKVVLVIESDRYTIEKMDDLKSRLAICLQKFEFPKEIYFLPTFIYSQSNKVLRKETLGKALEKSNCL